MIELLIFLALGGAGVIYAVSDSKTGFVRTKKFVNFVSGTLRGPQTPSQKVDKLMSAYAARVDKFRDGVSQLEANYHQSIKIAEEEISIAKDARSVAETAIKKGKEKEAEQAVTLALNAEERHKLYTENAARYLELSKSIRQELADVEGEFEMAKTSADTIRVFAEIAEMNKNLYEAISDISSNGFTPVGGLKQLVQQTERDAMASTIKIQLVQDGADAQKRTFRQLTQGVRVEEEVEKIKKKAGIFLTQGEKTETTAKEEVIEGKTVEK